MLAEQDGQQIDPVEAAVRRQAHAGGRCDRRKVVEGRGEHAAHLLVDGVNMRSQPPAHRVAASST